MSDARVPWCGWWPATACCRPFGPRQLTRWWTRRPATLLNMGVQPVCYPRVPLEPGRPAADVDGVLLGGSDTNVDPRLWGESRCARSSSTTSNATARARAGPPGDRAARAGAGFCHGSRHQRRPRRQPAPVAARPGAVKHWEDPDESLEEAYAERHFVTCTPGGELEKITRMGRFPALAAFAGREPPGRGPGGGGACRRRLVEAVLARPAGFAWGFQFHPEWGWAGTAYGRIMNAYPRVLGEPGGRSGVQQRPLQPIVA